MKLPFLFTNFCTGKYYTTLSPGHTEHLRMMLTFDVGCTGVNRCGPLQASMLMLTLMLSVIRPLKHTVPQYKVVIGENMILTLLGENAFQHHPNKNYVEPIV